MGIELPEYEALILRPHGEVGQGASGPACQGVEQSETPSTVIEIVPDVTRVDPAIT